MLPEFTPEVLFRTLIPRQDWRPFPTIEDRQAWSRLPEEVRLELLQRGQALLGFAWPSLPATLFLEYARNGNRSHYEALHFQRRGALADLVIAECVESHGRFLDDIANGIWAICEESFWGVPAHVGMTQIAGDGLVDVAEPTVDLFVAETAALLAWTVYLLGHRLDTVSPLLCQRILLETKFRMLDPCLARDDFWWLSFQPGTHAINNWNPWVNSNWLATALLLEQDESRRRAVVEKVLRSLDIFLSVYGESGGCDEGPGYWGRAGASLFDCLELLYSASGGAYSVYDHPKIQNMGRFIYRAHIQDSYYVNFADASALNHPQGSLVYMYGERIADQKMMGFGAWLARQAGLAARVQRDSLGRVLPALFSLDRLTQVQPVQPLPQQYWFADIQVLTCREWEGSAQGFFLAAKGGHNGESHNHNDVGNFVIFQDGKPLIVDAGVETYSRKTFSAQRYEIWTMQSAYHSLLPSFLPGSTGSTLPHLPHTPGEGQTLIQQAPGRTYSARDVTCQVSDGYATIRLDLAPAYPPEAGLLSWQRTIALQRGQGIFLQDTFQLEQPAAAIHLGLLTPSQVEFPQDGLLIFRPASLPDGRQSGQGRLLYPQNLFEVRYEEVPISDERLRPVWGERLGRIVLTTRSSLQAGEWNFRWEKLD
jgi:hypothetical protein